MACSKKQRATSNERRAMSEKRGESDEAVGRGPRARRFSGNERNQANATTRAVPERAVFLFGLFGEQSLHRGTVPTMEQSLQQGTVPASQACNGGCRERFPTVPPGSPSTSSG
jgi:hypothetical protein